MQAQNKGGDSRRMIRTRHPGIYKRGNRYVIVWKRDGRQHKEYFDSLVEAREAKGLASAGKRTAPSRVTVREYADRWIETYEGRTDRGFSETTRVEYRRDLDSRIKPYLGAKRLSDVTLGDLKAWTRWLRDDRGCSIRAIEKSIAVLSAMLGDAAEEELVESNPVRNLGRKSRPKSRRSKPRGKPRGLTAADMAALDKAVAELAEKDREARRTVQPWRLVLFPFLRTTGLRISEALGVTWRDLDLFDEDGVTLIERPTVEINDQVYVGARKALKTANAYRTLPLSPGVAFALARLHAETMFGAPGDPVFASSTGTPMRDGNIRRRILDPAIERSGVEWPQWEDADDEGAEGKRQTFHAFRHFAASHLHHNGKTPRQLADWLGHADAGFTMTTYVGQTGDGLGDAAFFDELVPATEEP